MKIAVLGGGIAGLTASYYLAKGGHSVVIYEKESYLGGLAAGFREKNWEWPLEYVYHHIFKTDKHILRFAEETGFDKFYFTKPETNSLYFHDNNYRIIPVDSPKNFLLFPYLSIFSKIRAGFWLYILMFFPFFKAYERITAEEFTTKYMGKDMWNVFFKELFRKKFGKYAGNILATFLWARFRRSQELGYVRGGFQTFIDHQEKIAKEQDVVIKTGEKVSEIHKKGTSFVVSGEVYDAVISTLPTPQTVKICKQIFPEGYTERLNKMKFLNALVMILETDKPILERTYWLNICTDAIPIMFIGQHTNFVDKKYYGGNHIAYAGYYLEEDDSLLKKSADELERYIVTYLKKINPNFTVIRSFRFMSPYAQAIVDKEYLANKPDMTTPVKNFYCANMDLMYPFDRGTNYAVKVGKEIAELIQ